MIIYHGTTEAAARGILKRGFKKNECSDFGKAAYFSTEKSFCEGYGKFTVTAIFTGKLLTLQNNEHFENFKLHPNEQIIKKGFDALKDGLIIAVYNTKAISNIKLHSAWKI